MKKRGQVTSFIIVGIVALILVIILLLFGSFKIYYYFKSPQPCKEDSCSLDRYCEKNSDCIVSCGCECVSVESKCPLKTKLGSCPIGGLECGCQDNKCTYATQQEFT